MSVNNKYEFSFLTKNHHIECWHKKIYKIYNIHDEYKWKCQNLHLLWSRTTC
jgi:hypothetical protein